MMKNDEVESKDQTKTFLTLYDNCEFTSSLIPGFIPGNILDRVGASVEQLRIG